MRGPVEAVPVEASDLDEAEDVCTRCNLVHWLPAGPSACEEAVS